LVDGHSTSPHLAAHIRPRTTSVVGVRVSVR